MGGSPASSPVLGYNSPPEYLYSPYPGEYMAVALEPPGPLENDGGPSTADIIANQSQDYVDERLAEYQATIYLLQGTHFNNGSMCV